MSWNFNIGSVNSNKAESVISNKRGPPCKAFKWLSMLLLAAEVVETKNEQIACACKKWSLVLAVSIKVFWNIHMESPQQLAACNSAEFDQKLPVDLDPFGLALKTFVNFDQ